MSDYSLSHLADAVLSRELAASAGRERGVTAMVIAHVAEFDARKLYVPAGFPSMYMFCVHELHLSEDAAFKRIRVARAARRFPAIYPRLADGRLNLSSVVLLVPHLTEDTADGLLEDSAHRTKSEIERLLAERFPRLDVPTLMQAVPTPDSMDVKHSSSELAPGPVESLTQPLTCMTPQLAPDRNAPSDPAPIEPPTPQARVTPIAPQRFAMQVTIRQDTHDLLRQAQDLLGHEIQSGDVAEVLHRALKAFVAKLESRKFAATDSPRPRRRRRSRENPRYIASEVKRAVWNRDGGQCTFVSESGQRCPARSSIEFDHVEEVARGGTVTVAGIRLRCRAHNQYTAECTFGREFMQNKREQARTAAKPRTAKPRTSSPAPACGRLRGSKLAWDAPSQDALPHRPQEKQCPDSNPADHSRR